MHDVFCLENLKGKRSLGRPRRRSENNNGMNLRETGWKLWTGCIWLRIGITGGLLCTR
jgi:hypothetical protein